MCVLCHVKCVGEVASSNGLYQQGLGTETLILYILYTSIARCQADSRTEGQHVHNSGKQESHNTLLYAWCLLLERCVRTYLSSR